MLPRLMQQPGLTTPTVFSEIPNRLDLSQQMLVGSLSDWCSPMGRPSIGT